MVALFHSNFFFPFLSAESVLIILKLLCVVCHVFLIAFVVHMFLRYRPVLPASFVEKALAFGSLAECMKFLGMSGVVLVGDENQSSIDCKQSWAVVGAL